MGLWVPSPRASPLEMQPSEIWLLRPAVVGTSLFIEWKIGYTSDLEAQTLADHPDLLLGTNYIGKLDKLPIFNSNQT